MVCASVRSLGVFNTIKTLTQRTGLPQGSQPHDALPFVRLLNINILVCPQSDGKKKEAIDKTDWARYYLSVTSLQLTDWISTPVQPLGADLESSERPCEPVR